MDDKVTPLFAATPAAPEDPKLTPLDIASRAVWSMMGAIEDVKRIAETHPDVLARVAFTLEQNGMTGLQGMAHVLKECQTDLALVETAIQNRSAARSKLPAFATVFADHEVTA